MKTKDKRQKEFFDLYGKNLSYLLKEIKEAGYSTKELSNFEFKTDYGDCYYEGDNADIKIVYNEK